jgi:RecB family exonuclease
VERWATCPFSYLLERVIGVEPTERPEREVAWAIGAAARGTLVHDILHRFLAELGAHGRPRSTEPYGAEDRRRIVEIAGEEFGRLEAAGATGHRLAWENERRGILADLQTFLQRDEELRGDGLVPTFFEQGFGMAGDSWAELVLDLGGGRAARLRGRIDRIDLGPDPAAPERARLIDYKTGRPYEERAFVDDALVAGTRVQPSVYAGAIRARHPGIRVDSGYWFVSARGNFRFLAVPDDQDRLSHVLDVVDRGLRAGAFPQVPGPDDSRRDRTSWQNCFHCAFDRICPTGRDQMRERKRDRPGPAIHLELGDAT